MNFRKLQFIIISTLLFTGVVFAQQKKSNMMENNKIQIDIWSDIVCPFCYVGKKKLEKAIEKLQITDKIIIQWHSFELAPDFPKNKVIPSTQYLTEVRGYPLAQLQKAQEHLTQQGKEYGITFNFEKALSFNTFDVHRLWKWSQTIGKGNEFKEELMFAYFTLGMDLSQQENILNIVYQVGLDKQNAKEILLGNDYAQDVLNDQKMAREKGIGGVPYFIINGKQVISGAQDDRIFESALSGALKTIPNSHETSCKPTGECD
jgi:predicted DsbA family dithiol-disulfide isomerase